MAEIRDELILEIDQALRDVDRIETALDRALAPVEVKIDIDERELQNLESTLQEVQRIADRAATETQSIALAAGKAEVNFEDLARAMGISEAHARDLTTELLQSQAASNRLEDSARDVARQLGLSDNEVNRLTTSLRQADRAAEAIDVTAVRVGRRFTDLRTAAAGIATAFAAIGVGQLFSVAIRGANTAIQSFARLEDSINAVNVVFKEGAGIALDFGETAAQAAGLSQEAFNNAVAPIGALLTNFGSDAREAADAAVILVQRGADLASVYGGSVQEALLAINSALVGQVEPLRRFGAEISQSRVEAFALASGLLKAGQEMDTTTAVQARLGLILADTNVVAGDFAATAEDLANAQRIAAAEVQNFGAEIGEVLAPALEDLLALLPGVIEGVRQLVPSFAAGGDSAAAFFESIGEGGGFRTEFALVEAGLATVFGGGGLLAEAGLAIAGLSEDLLTLDADFTKSTAALVRGGTLIERAFTRSIGVELAKALDKGTDASEAFLTAIRRTAAGSQTLELFTLNYRDFALAADLTTGELAQNTRELINNAEAIGLTASEVDFLEDRLRILNETLDTGGRANAEYLASIAGGDPVFVHSAETLARWAEQAEDAQTTGSAALTQLAADAEAQLQRASDAFDLFADLPDQIGESFASAVEDLADQLEDVANFEANLARLAAEGLDALVKEFRAQGPAAATQVVQALNDLDLARDADQLLQGIAGPAIEGFGAEFVDELVARGISRQVAQELADTLTSAEVIAAVEAAGNEAATAAVSFYGSGLLEGLDQIDVATAAANVAAGLKAANVLDAFRLAGEAGAQTYIRAFTGIGGLQESSPSKVFMDIGERTADAFSLGWDQANLTLRTPLPSTTGGVVTTSTSSAGTTGANVQLIINNPTMKDAVSDTARLAQIAGSVAQTYNAVRN